MQVRELEQGKVQKAVQGIINDAELFDQEFIELRWMADSEDNEKILGVDSIRILKGRKRGQSFTSPVGYDYIKDGVVQFHPDSQARVWGYLSDTPKNRIILASTFKFGTVKIMDKTVRNEIIELCAIEGLPTNLVARDHSLDDYLSAGKENKKAIEQTKTIEVLQAELAIARARLNPVIVVAQESELDQAHISVEDIDADILASDQEQREIDLVTREADLVKRELVLKGIPEPVAGVKEVIAEQVVAPVVVKVIKTKKKTSTKKKKK